MYFKVSFKYSDTVYCSNIAKADTAEDVSAHYAKYSWVDVQEAAQHEVDAAMRRGMPVINCPHIEPEQPESEAQDRETETAEIVSYPRLRAELKADAQRRKDEAAERISKGYLDRWNPANRPASADDGLHYYSTNTRWEQYQRGEISREKPWSLPQSGHTSGLTRTPPDSLPSWTP